MLRILIALVFSSGLLGVMAQTDTAFMRLFGGGGIDKANDLIATDDGGYLIAGSSASFDNDNAQAYFLKLDEAGNIEWSALYGGSGQEQINDVIQTQDGGYAAVGFSNSIFSGAYQLYLLKLDAAGNLDYQWMYGGDDWDFGHAIVETSPENFYIVGETYSFGSGSSDGWIVNYRHNATPVPFAAETYGSDSIDYFRSIDALPDGSLLVTGGTTKQQSGYLDAVVVRYDDFLTQVTEQFYGEAKSDYFNHIRATDDLAYVCTGSSQRLNDDVYVMYSIRYDLIGDSLQYEFFYNNIEGEGRKSIDHYTGQDVLFGMTTSLGDGKEEFFWQFTSSFSGGTAGTPESDQPYGIVNKHDSTGYLLVGYTDGVDAVYEDVLLYYMNSSMNSGSEPNDRIITDPDVTGTQEPESIPTFSVFPNPANDRITINGLSTALNSVHVTDIMGRTLYETTESGSLISIPTASWPTGMVIVSVIDDSGNHLKESVIIDH